MDAATRRFTWHYAKTQIKLKYRYTFLGFLWNFLEPALFLGVLSVVFSVVNKMDIGDYAVFLFAALVPWRYFEKVVNTCMDSIVGGDWLLKKIYVAPVALPLTRWTIATVEFLFSLFMVLLLFLYLKSSWSVHLIVLPAAMILWAMFGLGAGLLAAVVFTFFRDVRVMIQMVLMLAFFSSPILFKADMFQVHSLQALVIQWHPLTYFAALFQKPIYYGTWPSATDWGVAVVVSSLTLAFGYRVLQKYRGQYYFYL
jgi:lipopolysaccharide transport system permease protein